MADYFGFSAFDPNSKADLPTSLRGLPAPKWVKYERSYHKFLYDPNDLPDTNKAGLTAAGVNWGVVNFSVGEPTWILISQVRENFTKPNPTPITVVVS
jgi:hypothetical protein